MNLQGYFTIMSSLVAGINIYDFTAMHPVYWLKCVLRVAMISLQDGLTQARL